MQSWSYRPNHIISNENGKDKNNKKINYRFDIHDDYPFDLFLLAAAFRFAGFGYGFFVAGFLATGFFVVDFFSRRLL